MDLQYPSGLIQARIFESQKWKGINGFNPSFHCIGNEATDFVALPDIRPHIRKQSLQPSNPLELHIRKITAFQFCHCLFAILGSNCHARDFSFLGVPAVAGDSLVNRHFPIPLARLGTFFTQDSENSPPIVLIQ
jgi:hypothetical protein